MGYIFLSTRKSLNILVSVEMFVFGVLLGFAEIQVKCNVSNTCVMIIYLDFVGRFKESEVL